MELLDLALQIEIYFAEKGLKASETTVKELLDMLNEDGLEELSRIWS